MNELDRKINELAFNLGMSRQHKKLVKQLIVEFTQDWYHKGYHEGYDDASKEQVIECGPDYNEGHDFWTEIKEKSE
jgi:hypothetical protein